MEGKTSVVREAKKVQQKQPIQLDLFIPYSYQWEFKIVLTNKKITPGKKIAYHNGRGSQESIFAELKSCNQMGYIPTNTWEGNKVYMLSAILAHNLSRKLQMISQAPERSTKEKRPALWKLKTLGTLREEIIQRASRINCPQGKLILSMTKKDAVKDEMLHYLEKIRDVAVCLFYATLGVSR